MTGSKPEVSSPANLGSVDQLRDILFGDPLRHADERFDQLTMRLAQHAEVLDDTLRHQAARLAERSRLAIEAVAAKLNSEREERLAAQAGAEQLWQQRLAELSETSTEELAFIRDLLQAEGERRHAEQTEKLAILREQAAQVAELAAHELETLGSTLHREQEARKSALEQARMVWQQQGDDLIDWTTQELQALAGELQAERNARLQAFEQLAVSGNGSPQEASVSEAPTDGREARQPQAQALQEWQRQVAEWREQGQQMFGELQTQLAGERQARERALEEWAQSLRRELGEAVDRGNREWQEWRTNFEAAQDQKSGEHDRMLSELRDLAGQFASGLAELRQRPERPGSSETLEDLALELKAARAEAQAGLADLAERLERELIQVRGASTDRQLLGGIMTEMSARWRAPRG